MSALFLVTGSAVFHMKTSNLGKEVGFLVIRLKMLGGFQLCETSVMIHRFFWELFNVLLWWPGAKMEIHATAVREENFQN